jgi:hypothetical protein
MLYFPLYILTGAENLEVNIETPIAQEKKIELWFKSCGAVFFIVNEQ